MPRRAQNLQQTRSTLKIAEGWAGYTLQPVANASDERWSGSEMGASDTAMLHDLFDDESKEHQRNDEHANTHFFGPKPVLQARHNHRVADNDPKLLKPTYHQDFSVRGSFTGTITSVMA